MQFVSTHSSVPNDLCQPINNCDKRTEMLISSFLSMLHNIATLQLPVQFYELLHVYFSQKLLKSR